MACRCDICGKFRKDKDVVAMEYTNWLGLEPDHWTECKYCMSESDFETYYPDEEYHA